MSSDHVISGEEIFLHAMEIADPVQRQAYLVEACKDNDRLRAEITSLLAAHDRAGVFLDQPALCDAVPTQEPAISESPGTVIGPYTLREKIGEGGMAVVYRAEQEEPLKREVALKIIKLGMDTKQVIGRFEAERQTLAMMDHPNIAKVLDAGATETGRPYFVMELVDGVSITEYCDQNGLSTQARLELFASVCYAVNHAHQKGIIHRDLKPSNILVTQHDGQPVPKVIDFGIAKATDQRLDEQTVLTRLTEIVGTPEYMSPEQAAMGEPDIDTRTDIYSLGVVLYVLLTGALPFDPNTLRAAALGEIQRIIREEEPQRPSTRLSGLGEKAVEIATRQNTDVANLTRRLRQELEWIPLKAMRKGRDRRYASASEFAQDLANYLQGTPLIAGPESAVYRSRKFVRRHWVPMSAVTAVVVAIVVGFIISTVMYFRAEQAREKEAIAHSETKAVSDFLADDLLGSVHPEQAKSPEISAQYFLQKVSENLDNRSGISPLQRAIFREKLTL